jgi:hypothetical protein
VVAVAKAAAAAAAAAAAGEVAAEHKKQQLRRLAERVPPADLVGRRIEIDGKGACSVLGPFKKGRIGGLGASKHLVVYEGGLTETLLLRRNDNGGDTFVLLDGAAGGGGAAAAQPSGGFEFQNEHGSWCRYSAAVGAAVCAAQARRDAEAKFSHGQQKYTLCFATMQQKNDDTGVMRPVRAVPMMVRQTSTEMPLKPGTKVGAAVKHELRPSASVGFESFHYNQAVGHLKALGGKANPTLVEYWENEPLANRFHAAQMRLAQHAGAETTKVWVFHGTKDEVVPQIMQHGFKVGGEGDVKVANGSAYGQGVYSATGPGTPMGYVKGRKMIIIAKGLKGRFQDTERGGANADSWRGPRGREWCIFRSGDQLLPVYVVHYDDE